MLDPAWLLLLLPLGAAVLNYLLFPKNGVVASMISTVAVLGTLGVTIMLLGQLGHGEPPVLSFEWIKLGSVNLDIGLLLDGLAVKMMLIVTGIGSLVHIFSLIYMKDDEARARYFTGLSLFMFSMTGIVLATNFIMMFMFWELVGLSSYLLIGHWYHKDSAADAAKKAFLTNRIGDFGFMIGILMLWKLSGHVSFEQLELWANSHPTVSAGLMGATVLLIFCGAIGKSAQLPLHIWLPDAMEGPTPVSALIHAATMVAAGVFMMVRFFLCLDGQPAGGSHEATHAVAEVAPLIPAWSMQTIAWIGAITSLAAALMATQQNDIKKILAYSTLSQLGYMVMAVGCSGGEAAMFHLYTHAWFKALLFLGSGAVIYACHHEQDIWKMGGLLKKMPITSITFILGTFALIAVPGFSGFFSKEQILVVALDESPVFFGIAATVAALTTFYMLRLFFVAFLGKPRGHGAEEAKEVPLLMLAPLLLLAGLAIASGYPMIAGKIAPNFHYHPFHVGPEFFASLIALAVGIVLAVIFYLGKTEDKLANNPVARFFANRLYLDHLYAKIVTIFQDVLAAIVHFFDELVINSLLVGGFTRIAGGFGNFFRRVQSGNLQGYSVALGIGVLVVIYLTTFLFS